jgi:hypothetical protein
MRLAMMGIRTEAKWGEERQEEKKNGIFHAKRIIAAGCGIGRAFISLFFGDLHNRNNYAAR